MRRLARLRRPGEAKEDPLAKKSMRLKALRTPKFKVRAHNRCPICGRPRGFLRRFGVCRICFRTLASWGKLPGVTKSSW